MPKAYNEFLRHILFECNWIESQFGAEVTEAGFLMDETLK